jgi:hypothetical protein
VILGKEGKDCRSRSGRKVVDSSQGEWSHDQSQNERREERRIR